MAANAEPKILTAAQVSSSRASWMGCSRWMRCSIRSRRSSTKNDLRIAPGAETLAKPNLGRRPQRNADAVTMIMSEWLEPTDAGEHARSCPSKQLIAVGGSGGDARYRSGADRTGPRASGAAYWWGSRGRRWSGSRAMGNISRALMVGPSEVLDLGRTSRVATNSPVRALIARDQYFPVGRRGAKEPPNRCQAHHLSALDARRAHRSRQSRTLVLVPPPPTTSSG